MTNQLQIFNFNSKEVRTISINSEPWIVAKDVMEILGYVWAGMATIKHVPEKWRGVNSVLTPSGTQEMICLSEQGLYFFLGRSDKEKAQIFQEWIAGEVLPSIRKTGQYNMGNFKIPKTYSEALRLAADQADQIEIMKPKAIGYDTFISNKSSQKIGDVAKVFGLKPNTLHKMLRDAKIMQDNYTPYAQYQHYFKTVETPTPAGFNKFTSYLLPEGVAFITIKFNLIEISDDQIVKIN